MPTPATEEDNGGAPLRRNQNFRRLLWGSSISMLGSRVSSIAFPLLILTLTRSAVEAGWATFAVTAPSILVYLPAGAFVDRWNPRGTMLVSELVRGLAVAAIVAFLLLGTPSVYLLIVLAAIEEIFEIFSVLAERRLTQSVVDTGHTEYALTRSEARAHLVVLIGRPLGGILFGLWPVLPFGADLLSFVVSAGSILRVRGLPRTRAESTQNRHLTTDIRKGFGWLREHRFALFALPVSGITTVTCQALIMIFLIEADTRHKSALTIGLVLSASGLGGVLGSTAAVRLFPRRRYSLFRYQLWAWIAILAWLGLSGAPSTLKLSLAMAILGFTGALGNIAVDAYVVRNAADTMLGRVMSIERLISFGALALGPPLGGVLVAEAGLQNAILWLFVITLGLLIVPAVALPFKQDRSLDRDGNREAWALTTLQHPAVLLWWFQVLVSRSVGAWSAWPTREIRTLMQPGHRSARHPEALAAPTGAQADPPDSASDARPDRDARPAVHTVPRPL
jgi:MFS family permease